MLGFDVMRADWRDALRERAFRRGLILLPAGDRVLRFYPRYDTEPSAIDEALSILRLAIEDVLVGHGVPEGTPALKTRVDDLLSRIAETDERMAAIDGRRKLVDEVQTKANAIVHLLDDVRINLESLGEQKAVVNHTAEKVAQLEFMLQEARNTLRTLQHEREIAERIEQNIKQLRAKTA